MPVAPTYPGVYIEEIPSGVHTIIGVSTSITAILGRTARGPANQPITLTSFADYERSFGALNPGYPVSYTVRDFFSNGGSEAIIIRLFRDAAKQANAQAAAAVAKAVSDAYKANNQADLVAAANAAAGNYVNKPGKAGADAAAKAVSDAKAANKQPPDIVAAGQAAAAQQQGAVDNAYEGAASYLITKQWGAGNLDFQLTVNGPGTWGQTLFVAFDQNGITQEVADRYGLTSKDQLFNIQVFDNSSEPPYNDLLSHPPLETIRNVTVWKDAGERRIDRVLGSQSNLLRYTGGYAATEGDAKFVDANVSVPPPADPSKDPAPPAFTNGLDSDPLDLATYEGDQAMKTGFYALEDADLFNLMCVPPDDRNGDTAKEVYDAALKYCVQRRAVLILDPPADWNNRVALLSDPGGKLSSEVNLSGEAARNAFLYYPRVKMADPMRGGQYDVFPASGIIAGVFARTDASRGVWKAPAGLDASLGGVFLEVNLTDRENGILNPLAINCLRSFPVSGKVVWGSRTLRGADQLADEYKYLPVRRTALYIEESLYRGTQWVVFQPNDEPLWAQIRLNVGSFMNDLFRKGAFQGARPQDAYFVRCDHSTTTQNDIDRGIVNIVVGFAPLKPAEFVIIQLQQIA